MKNTSKKTAPSKTKAKAKTKSTGLARGKLTASSRAKSTTKTAAKKKSTITARKSTASKKGMLNGINTAIIQKIDDLKILDTIEELLTKLEKALAHNKKR